MSVGLPAGSYNAAVDLIERNLEGRADKIAIIDESGAYTYRELAERSSRTGQALRGLGLQPGDRIALVLLDGIDFVSCFLGALRVGVVPILLNTLFPSTDYAYILTDSGARAVVVSESLGRVLDEAIAQSGWSGEKILAGSATARLTALRQQAGLADAYRSSAEDVAFWLYSSGSTGRPKGAPHRHGSMVATAELFGRQVFGLREEDVVFSAAKLFFAYGLGNALTFPLYVGATSVLYSGRVTPALVNELLARHGVTVFCGVPTLFSAMIASDALPRPPGSSLRVCLSAGEALPEEIGLYWTRSTGVEIVDGIGSTEMLHIFVSNRPGNVRYGTTGLPVPGYEVRLVGEGGEDVGPGQVGELFVRGPSMTLGYWNQPEKTEATFVDGWMRTGDKFELAPDGALVHRGRADDMLKVSGIWVSPVEVESALIAHPAVREAAVIGVGDPQGLMKTKAFVVVGEAWTPGDELAEELKRFVKGRIAPHKYPRSVEFVLELPKTATGKIRRHVLREREAAKARRFETQAH